MQRATGTRCARVWEINTGNMVLALDDMEGMLQCAEFTSDGSVVVVILVDKSLRTERNDFKFPVKNYEEMLKDLFKFMSTHETLYKNYRFPKT